MIKGEFGYLGLDVKSNDFVMVLKRTDNGLHLPIWIGNSEAFAIAIVLAGIKPPRPQTHDLMNDIITSMGGKVSRIIVTGLKDSTYFALIHIDRGDVETYIIDARPSDSVALALRTKCDILINDEISCFDFDFPENDFEKELSERIKPIDPNEMLGI